MVTVVDDLEITIEETSTPANGISYALEEEIEVQISIRNLGTVEHTDINLTSVQSGAD